MNDQALPPAVVEKRWLQRVTLSIAPARLPPDAVLMVGETRLAWTPMGHSGAQFDLTGAIIAKGDCTVQFVGAGGIPLSAPCLLPIRSWVAFGTLVGFIDHVERLRDQVVVKGWAVDWRAPQERVQIGLEIEGRIVALARADIFRHDLKQLGLGDGRQAFAFCILGNALQEDEEVVLRLMANGAPLHGSPVRLGGSATTTPGATVIGRLHAAPEGEPAWDMPGGDPPAGTLPVDVELPLPGEEAGAWALLHQATLDHPQADLLVRRHGTSLPAAQALRLVAALRANACAGFAAAVVTTLEGSVTGGGYRMLGADFTLLQPPRQLAPQVVAFCIPGAAVFHAPVLRAALEDCGPWLPGRDGSPWAELAAALLARGRMGLVDPGARATAPYRHPEDRRPPSASPASQAAFRAVQPRRRPQRLVELSPAADLEMSWQALAELLLRRAVVWTLLDHRPVVALPEGIPKALSRRLRAQGLEVLEGTGLDGLDAAERPLRHRLLRHPAAASALALDDLIDPAAKPVAQGLSLQSHPLALLPAPDPALTAAMLRAQMIPLAPARDAALWRQRVPEEGLPLDRLLAAHLAVEAAATEAAPGAEQARAWLQELQHPRDVETTSADLAALAAARSPEACAGQLRAALADLGY